MLRVKELANLLDQFDPEMEVVVRVSFDGDVEIEEVRDLDGEYLDLTDDRSVLEENSRLVIIADLVEQ